VSRARNRWTKTKVGLGNLGSDSAGYQIELLKYCAEGKYRSVPFIVSGSLCYSALPLATSVSDDHGFIEATLGIRNILPSSALRT
jgi:hypothetical protein